MTVLGVSGGPQGAAAVARDGRILAIVTEDLVRGSGHDDLPGAAIDAALDRAGLRPSHVGHVRLVSTGGSEPGTAGPWARLRAHLADRALRARLQSRLDNAIIVAHPASARGDALLPGSAGVAARAALSVWPNAPVDASTGPGPHYPELEIHRKLGVAGLPRHKADDPAADVAASLRAGDRVAWFAGGAEVTPWALGHRAVLRLGRPEPQDIVVASISNANVLGWNDEAASVTERTQARMGGLLVAAGRVEGTDTPTRLQVVDEAHPLAPVLAVLASDHGAPRLLCAAPWREPDTGLRVCTPYEAARAFRDDRSLAAAALGPYIVRR